LAVSLRRRQTNLAASADVMPRHNARNQSGSNQGKIVAKAQSTSKARLTQLFRVALATQNQALAV
jgi:hypothetical protein